MPILDLSICNLHICLRKIKNQSHDNVKGRKGTAPFPGCATSSIKARWFLSAVILLTPPDIFDGSYHRNVVFYILLMLVNGPSSSETAKCPAPLSCTEAMAANWIVTWFQNLEVSGCAARANSRDYTVLLATNFWTRHSFSKPTFLK